MCFSQFYLLSCKCTTPGCWVGTICSDTWGTVILEAGRAIEGDGCWVGEPWVTPPSVCGQYLSLSCWARSLSPTGWLSRASVRMFQVGGGLDFSQTVSISSRRLLIWLCSVSIHLRVSIGTCNCTPRENHLSQTGCSSQCKDLRSPWPTECVVHGSTIIIWSARHLNIQQGVQDGLSMYATRYSLFAYSHFAYFRPKSGLLVMFWTIKYTKPPLLLYLDISVCRYFLYIFL